MNPLRFLAIVVAVFATLALLSWMLAVPAAAADVPCMPRADLVSQLRDNYGESLTARLLTQDEGALIEIYTAPGSWTILVMDAAGRSCMVGSGGAWVIQGVPQGEAG